MSPSIELTPSTFSRLQGHAVPLVDTIESGINRLIDAYEKGSGGGQAADGQQVRSFNASTPPDLTHAKILGVTFCGKPLGRGQDNWNGLLNAVVREAKARAKSPAEFKQMLAVNYVEGQKQDEGYRYLADLNLSVQGQDANGAWRAISQIVQQIGCPLTVKFAWREKEGAAFPGVVGRFAIGEA
ncbi:MAG: hypothetical protein J0H57_28570 [Rhodospirillales bacterium]|nr:hypothetical protein [Rhodospirillales bacterium]